MQGNREKKKLAVVVIQRWRDGVRKDFTFKTLVKYFGEFKWDAVLLRYFIHRIGKPFSFGFFLRLEYSISVSVF